MGRVYRMFLVPQGCAINYARSVEDNSTFICPWAVGGKNHWRKRWLNAPHFYQVCMMHQTCEAYCQKKLH